MSEESKFSLSEWSSERGPLPPRNDKEDYGDYFRRLLTKWSFRAKEAERVHETWRRRLQLSGIRMIDCHQRIFIVLRELMESAFLKNEYIDTGMPREDREHAIEELKKLGYDELCQMEGADWKFALLSRHLRKQGSTRVVVDEQMAGFYIDEMHDIITDEAAEAFFRFATLTRLAYQEMENLQPAQTKDDDKSSEQKAVEGFVKKITTLANRAYEKYNGQMVSPGVNKADVEIVILKDKLVSRMQSRMKNDFDELKALCYPENAQSKAQLCKYVRQLKQDGFFGKLPNKLIAELFAPIVGLSEGSVKNHLSQS